MGDGDPQPDHAALPTSAALARGRCHRARLAEAARLEDDPRAVGRGSGRAPDPRCVAGRRTRVRASALSGVHRDRAGRAGRGARPGAVDGRLMRLRAPLLTVVALTALGALLRFPTIDRQSFWLDELVTVSLL